jgi:hypothetical protein
MVEIEVSLEEKPEDKIKLHSSSPYISLTPTSKQFESGTIGEKHWEELENKKVAKNHIHQAGKERFRFNFVFSKKTPLSQQRSLTTEERQRIMKGEGRERQPPLYQLLQEKVDDLNEMQIKRNLKRKPPQEKIINNRGVTLETSNDSRSEEPRRFQKSSDQISRRKNSRKPSVLVIFEEKTAKTESHGLEPPKPIEGVMRDHLQMKAILATSNLLLSSRRCSKVSEDLENLKPVSDQKQPENTQLRTENRKDD